MEQHLISALKLGDLTTIKTSLNSDPDEAILTDGKTPLHLAALHGHPHIVQHLILRGANVNALDQEGHTPLHLAAENGDPEVVRLLLGSQADPCTACRRHRHTPLHKAVQHHQLDAIRLLIDAGADVNATAKERITPLHLAAERGDADSAQMLIAHGADVNAKDQVGWSPLHLAVEKRHDEFTEVLLQMGPDPNITNKHGYTPLHVAATCGNLNAVRLLQQHGADLHAVTKALKTAFDLAADAEHVHLLTILNQDNGVFGAHGAGNLHMQQQSASSLSATATAGSRQDSGGSGGSSSSRSTKPRGLVAGVSRLLTRHKEKNLLVQEPVPMAAGPVIEEDLDVPSPSSYSQDQSFTPLGSPPARSCSHLTSSSVTQTAIFCPFCAQIGPRHPDVTAGSHYSPQGSRRSFTAPSSYSFASSTAAPADAPEMFLCPISKKLLTDPVVAGDGFTYDRHTITQWFESGHNDSPVTRKELRSKGTLPNLWVKSAVTEWLSWRTGLPEEK